MFGSDQVFWPDAIPIAIEAIEAAHFLTEQQKREGRGIDHVILYVRDLEAAKDVYRDILASL